MRKSAPDNPAVAVVAEPADDAVPHAVAEDRLLSKDRVAEILDVHPATINRLVAAGKFPSPIQIGGRGEGLRLTVRWSANEVQAWIETQRATRAS